MSGAISTLPFKIGIADHVLDDLRSRLRRVRRPRVLRKADWSAGTNPEYLDELIRYWRDDYDWRAQETALNLLDHYMARIGDAHVHYVHEPGIGMHTIPLLLLHGWPDSFLRYRRTIPHLIGASDSIDSATTFDVVVPSLPGFAFTGLVGDASEIPSVRYSARLLHRLMTEVLGYERFIVSGGDGGSAIAQSMALQFPSSIIGVHLTDIGWHDHGDEAALSNIEKEYLRVVKRRFMEDGAYAAVHMSQPRALAASLNDSPAGLASWIVDRFHAWSDTPRHFEDSIGRNELLTNITIYWVTQTIQSSIYGYLAEARQPSLGPRDYVVRPVGVAAFPRDIAGIIPRRLAERTLNIVHWTEMPRGGHFGASEYPLEFAADLFAFVASLEEFAVPEEHDYRLRKTL
jgi:pimeloyl-ACP methyl ester carboxylesterase